jgi:Arabinose efflux permease
MFSPNLTTSKPADGRKKLSRSYSHYFPPDLESVNKHIFVNKIHPLAHTTRRSWNIIIGFLKHDMSCDNNKVGNADVDGMQKTATMARTNVQVVSASGDRQQSICTTDHSRCQNNKQGTLDFVTNTGEPITEHPDRQQEGVINPDIIEQVNMRTTVTAEIKPFDYDASDNSCALAMVEEGSTVIGWNENDPFNPRNWSVRRKMVNIGLVCYLSFLVTLRSTFIAPGVLQIMDEFNASANLLLTTFVVSVYVLGLAGGPLFAGPLGESFGRLPLYHVSNVGFVGFTAACAFAPSLACLVAFRFLSGIFGGGLLTIGSSTIADLIVPDQRGILMRFYNIIPLIGPLIAPIPGSFVVAKLGWRWVFWGEAMMASATMLIMFVFLEETYGPILLQRRVKRLKRESGNECLQPSQGSRLTSIERLKQHFVQVARLFIFSPLCHIYVVCQAIIYGYAYVLLTTVRILFTSQDFYPHFTTSNIGLVFIGLVVGALIGLAQYWFLNSRVTKFMLASRRFVKPEHKLVPSTLGVMMMLVGYLLYGWGTGLDFHWSVPILGHLIT